MGRGEGEGKREVLWSLSLSFQSSSSGDVITCLVVTTVKLQHCTSLLQVLHFKRSFYCSKQSTLY